MTDDTKKLILIADDAKLNRKILRDICSELGHETIEVGDGREAVKVAGERLPDCIFMDVMMPEMDGFETTRLLKENTDTQHIPVIIVTALESREDCLKGIEAGADDVLTKPIDKQELTLRLKNCLRMKEYSDFLGNYSEMLEQHVKLQTRELREAHEGLKDAYRETIMKLTLAGEFKDKDTGSHIRRTSEYCRMLAAELGKDEEYQDVIYHAAPMHDIGKVAIPDRILLKEGPLDEIEWKIMKTHPGIGRQILGESTSPYLAMASEIAATHHERWDGGGYPHNLEGEEIPLAGRIMNIADQYDALRSKRPYKEPFTHEETVAILTEGDGRTEPGHFDPQVLKAFKRIHEKLEKITEELTD